MKICAVGGELLNADGQTDRQTDRHDEAKSRFSQFCESIKTSGTGCGNKLILFKRHVYINEPVQLQFMHTSLYPFY
jgi:hypothetical protein